MDSRCESGAASKSKKVRFRCDQTRQVRAVVGRGVGSFVQAKRIRRGLCVAGSTSSSRITKRLTFRGFIVIDFASQKAEFERDMAAWLRERKVKYREDIVDGLENAVPAFRGLLQGQNFGKLLV